MNEYLQQLYGWVSSNDNSFGERYTIEDFIENMNDEQYATRMYTWISEKDPTFQDRYDLDFFIEKVKKKSSPLDPSISQSMQDVGVSDGSQETN